jgi:hypothetical protein
MIFLNAVFMTLISACSLLFCERADKTISLQALHAIVEVSLRYGKVQNG